MDRPRFGISSLVSAHDGVSRVTQGVVEENCEAESESVLEAKAADVSMCMAVISSRVAKNLSFVEKRGCIRSETNEPQCN